MGIYIKCMEMPTNEPSLVKINSDGSVSTTVKNGYKKYEAVSVPPHGRLIDADALEQDAYKRLLFCTDEFQRPYEVMRAIAIAPTIIPAEEENDAR